MSRGSESVKRWRQKYPEKRAAQSRRRYLKHREKFLIAKGDWQTRISPTLKQRFDANTVRAERGCLEWRGHANQVGHGIMSVATGVTRGSHHAAWFLAYGIWPDRLRHTCDNPPCCDVAHLVEGTQKQNMEDKVARKRQARGMTHGRTKLTWEQVCEIRRRRAEGEKLKALAQEFHSSEANVSKICLGQARLEE